MNNKGRLVIVFLLVVAAFLVGSAGAKMKYQNGAAKVTPTPTVVPRPTPVPFNPKKSSQPEVKFFVMSFCPYGNVAEAGLEPVYQLLKDKVTWSPRYIISDQGDRIEGCKEMCPDAVYSEEKCRQEFDTDPQGEGPKVTMTPDQCRQQYPYQSTEECIKKRCDILKPGVPESLHGQVELNQDIREICALQQGSLDKWWEFVSLVNGKCSSKNADTCWKANATAAGLDINKISQCEKTQVKTLADKEIAEAEKYQASGSPTVFINDTIYNGGRSPEDYKKAICLAFENQPEECKTILGQESPAAGGGCE